MITTVGKAKEQWCPFDIGQASPREHAKGTCIGPECMMWRFWVPPPGSSQIVPGDKPQKHGRRDTDKLGYCGLAEQH